MKQSKDFAPISLIHGLQGVEWKEDHLPEMKGISAHLKPLLLDDHRRVVQQMEGLLDRWNRLDFPLLPLLEVRLSNKNTRARGMALERLLLMEKSDGIPRLLKV